MKKILFFSILFIFVFLFGISAFAVSEGDYVVIGEYNGQPLLWKCVSVSDEGIYVLSDRVIECRAFDSEGSNSWSESDIREYLNGEFLQNVLSKESSYINSVNIETISASSDNASQHIYNNGYTTSVQNADSSYKTSTTDKIFLPSLTEIQNVYTNVAGFGPDYYMGRDFEGNYVDYFLRDALGFGDGSDVRCVVSQMDFYYSSSVYYDRLIRSAKADNQSIGIRPAFILTNDVPLINGTGTAIDPYEVPGTYFCEIITERNVMNHGQYLSPEIFYSLSGEGQYIKYYCNGKEYDIDEACFIDYGENVLYARIYDAANNVIFQSEKEYIYGVFRDPGTAIIFDDFESDNPYYHQFSNGHNAVEGDSIEKATLEDGNTVLKFDAHSASTFMNSRTFNNYGDTLIFETDVMLNDWNFNSLPVFYVCVYENGVKKWLTPVIIKSNGTLLYDDGGNNRVVKDDIQLENWYKLTVVYDVTLNKSTFYIDGEPIIYNAETAVGFDYISYLNISYSTPGENSVVYFDNIGVYYSKQRLDGTRYGVPNYSVKDIKTYDFSTSNTSFTPVYKEGYESISQIVEVLDGHGKVGHMKTVNNDSKVSFSSSGRNVFSMSPQSGYGAMILEFEFKVLENGGPNSLLGAISYRNPDNLEKTWCVLHFTKDDKLYISNDIDYSASVCDTRILVDEYEKGKWHKVRYMIDTQKLIIYIYFDGILYAQVDCGRSVYSGTDSKVLSVDYSRSNCYLELQAMAPGSGAVNEIYIDNISHRYARSPIIYNLEYINNLEVVTNQSQIDDVSSLSVSFDLLKGDEAQVLCVASITDSSGELLNVMSEKISFDQNESLENVSLELTKLPKDISTGSYTINVMVWDANNLAPFEKKFVLPN